MFAYQLSNENFWRFNRPNRAGDISGNKSVLWDSYYVLDLKTNTYFKNRDGGQGSVETNKRLLNRLHRKAKRHENGRVK